MAESRSSGPSGFMKIVTRRYRMPDGDVTDWDLLDGGETVAVLALTGDGMVLLARQFRPGPSLELDEMPGGYVDEGESVLAAAARELLEETGLEAGDLQFAATVDNIRRDETGRVRFHYTIIDFATRWTGGEPVAATDVTGFVIE